MSKLPKSLEQRKDVLAGKYYREHSHEVVSPQEMFGDGFDSGALEIKQRADKLAEASRAFLLNRSIENSQKLNSALAEWDEFWKEGE